MASIRKRGDSYQITVSNGRRSDGSQIIETDTYTPEPGMTKRQIEKALNEFVVDFERDVKAGKNVKGERMTLQDLSVPYLKDMAPPVLEMTTYHDYKRKLELRILPRIGHVKIKDVNARLLKDYSESLRKDGARQDGKKGGLSEGTISKDLAIISAMMSFAVGEAYITINPIIYSGKQKQGRKAKKEYKVNCFTIEQTKWFLWALDNPIQVKRKAHDRKDDTGKSYHVPEYAQEWRLPLKWRVYFYIALFTGDRRGENAALTWKHLDFEKCEISIENSTAYVNGETYQKDTKTHSSRSNIVPPIVMEMAKKLKVQQQKESLELGDSWQGYKGKDFDNNFIFTQSNGKQMNLSSPYHEFKRIIRVFNENVAEDESQKIPDKATMHDLRHTAASILISNNLDPQSVAGVLGHKDPTTTLNIYSYFFRSKNTEAANIMQTALLDSVRKIE